VKCGECPNQAFLPVDDQVILDHLQGRHVVGVSPIRSSSWELLEVNRGQGARSPLRRRGSASAYPGQGFSVM